MSTICKLNPNVRAARKRRAEVIKQLHALRPAARDLRERFMLDGMITDLESVARSSYRAGLDSSAMRIASGVPCNSKESRFRAILNHSRIARNAA